MKVINLMKCYCNYSTMILLILLTFFINSCKKQSVDTFTFYGKIIDAQTMQPISNYPVRLGFVHPTTGISLNFFTRSDIAESATNAEGEFILKINKSYLVDSSDYYAIQSYDQSGNYFGIGKNLNAKHAETIKNNYLGILKNSKRLTTTFTITHTGPSNASDFIRINIDYLYHQINDFNGFTSVSQYSCDVVPNSPTIISWRGIKNNINFGPFIDTVSFTNSNNLYNISY